MLTLEVLRSQPIDKLYIHAIDMCIYLAEVDSGGCRAYIKNDVGQIARFSSRSEILDKFENYAVAEAWLVHRSAYDEMVGGPINCQNELNVRLF